MRYRGGGQLLQEKDGKDFYETLVCYMFYATNLDIEDIIETLNQISNHGGQIAMSTAEKLKQEGVKEGEKKGKEDVARMMIKEGFTIKKINDITGLKREDIEKLKKG